MYDRSKELLQQVEAQKTITEVSSKGELHLAIKNGLKELFEKSTIFRKVEELETPADSESSAPDDLQQKAFETIREAVNNNNLYAGAEHHFLELTSKNYRSDLSEVLETLPYNKRWPGIIDTNRMGYALYDLEDRLSTDTEPDHYRRPEGISFADIKESLMANPSILCSLAVMNRLCTMPDVIYVNDHAYIIGSCSPESNIASYISYPLALNVSNETRTNLMSHETYLKLANKGRFDNRTNTLLHTPDHIRATGNILYGGANANGYNTTPVNINGKKYDPMDAIAELCGEYTRHITIASEKENTWFTSARFEVWVPKDPDLAKKMFPGRPMHQSSGNMETDVSS